MNLVLKYRARWLYARLLRSCLLLTQHLLLHLRSAENSNASNRHLSADGAGMPDVTCRWHLRRSLPKKGRKYCLQEVMIYPVVHHVHSVLTPPAVSSRCDSDCPRFACGDYT